MKLKPFALITLILGIACTLDAAALTPPAQIHPPEGAVLTQSIPHFEWQRSEVLNPEAVGDCEIEISNDKVVFDRDRLAGVIGWYVPDRELPPGNYTWRIAAVDAEGKPGSWSPTRKFEVRRPERVLLVPQGADFQAIRQVIAEAAKQTPAIVKFAAGAYRLDPGELRYFIEMANVDDLEIDGSGATVVFTKPVTLIQLEHCNRVQVKNFTFDFDPPAYTAGRVVAVDAQAGTVEAEILPGHSLPDSLPAFLRDKKGMLVSESEGYAMKRDVPLLVVHDGCEPIEGRRYRFRFEKAAAVRVFAVGDIYVLDPRWLGEAGGSGTEVNGGEDVVFFNLTIRSAANECLASFYANRHAILHVRLERSAGRALSVNNGGNNHHNARTGPWLEGCLFENCGDDVCHVNGYAMSVASQPGPDRLRINYAQLYDRFGVQSKQDFRIGDRIQFYDAGQGRVMAERRVVEAVPEEKTLLVRLDGPVEGLITGRLSINKKAGYAAMDDVSVTQVFNASRMCNQFVFRHNIARNSRRVGVLAKGNGGLIEGNTFENLGGGGVEFWNAPFEGLAAENYMVRDNRILNCGRIARKHAGIWATMFKTGGDQLHRNLLFERNEIIGFPGSAILLSDVENVVLRENRIQAPPSKSEAIVLNNSANVQQTGNSIPRQTFCNPLNLDYNWRKGAFRHGADPVIVLFKDKYYLFSTWETVGFRVSDDLLNWTSHPFPASVRPLMTSDDGTYCAAAVATQGDWLYFINMIPHKADRHASIMRTRDPLSGVWERCGQIKKVKDPALFFDDDGRAWLYHGLRTPTRVFEIDTRTWTEIPNSEVQLRPDVASVAELAGGYERGLREVFAETDTGALLGGMTRLPCQEGAWMTKRNNRYYLQYSTPGTVSQWYCDVVMEGASPTGPFKLAEYSPVSFKVGGFIGSAGHSAVFQDKQGQWWRVTTMWVGVHDLFERRLGLFPVHFDQEGRMSTDTVMGDYPRGLRDGAATGWMVQSQGRKCTASSSLIAHPPELAADENVRTWWSAKTGGPGEWLQMDLGQSTPIHALQLNFAEHDATAAPADDYHAYRLLASDDGATWRTLVDKSASRASTPHDYLPLPQPVKARYLKVENVHTPCGGKFAIRDLRVFGPGDGNPPQPATHLEVTRHAADDRNATITWTASRDADGYLIRFGIAPDKLFQTIQLQGGNNAALTTHALTRGVNYSWRVDAFNGNGLTPSTPIPVH